MRNGVLHDWVRGSIIRQMSVTPAAPKPRGLWARVKSWFHPVTIPFEEIEPAVLGDDCHLALLNRVVGRDQTLVDAKEVIKTIPLLREFSDPRISLYIGNREDALFDDAHLAASVERQDFHEHARTTRRPRYYKNAIIIEF